MTILTMIMLAISANGWSSGLATDVDLAAEQVRQQHPEIALRVDQMEPIRNRAGAYFFPGADLVDERAQVLIQHRLIFGGEEISIRVALAHALDGEHRLPWPVIQTLPADLRAALLNGYKKRGEEDAREAFEGALVDSSVLVRAEAMRLLGYRPDVRSQLIDDGLRQGLRDRDAATRRLTVRSISWRTETWGFDAIIPLLEDTDPAVRGAAVRALGSLDRSRAQALPALKALQVDDDPQVARPLRGLLRP